MSFKILGFVYVATSVMVISGAAPNGQYGALHAHGDVDEAVTFPLLKRQEHRWRNETRSLTPSPTAWTSDTISHSSPTIREESTIPVTLSTSAYSTVATPTRSPPDSSVIQPSHQSDSLITSSDVLSPSKIISVATSQSAPTSTFEQILSSSSSFIPSVSQHHTPATQSTPAARSDVTSVYISSIIVPFSTSTIRSTPDALSGVTSVHITSTVAPFRTSSIQSTPDSRSTTTLVYTTPALISISTRPNSEQSRAPDVTSTKTSSLVNSSPDSSGSSIILASNSIPDQTQNPLPSAGSLSASEKLPYTSRVSFAALSASSSSKAPSSPLASIDALSTLWSSSTASKGNQGPIATASLSSYNTEPSNLSSSQVTIVTYISLTASSTVLPPLESGSFTAISSLSSGTYSSIVSSKQETLSNLGPTETWTQSLSKATSIPLLPQVPPVPGNSTSFTILLLSLQTSSSSFQSDMGLAPQSNIGLQHATPSSSWLTLTTLSSNGTPYSSIPTPESLIQPSNGVKSSVTTTAGSQPRASSTTSVSHGASDPAGITTLSSSSVSTSIIGALNSSPSSLYATERNGSSTATLGLPIVSISQHGSAAVSATVTLATIPAQATLSVAAQSSSKSTSGDGAWNFTSGANPLPSSIHQSGVALSTGFVASSIKSEVSLPSLTPDWTNSTVPNLVVNTTASVAAAIFTISPSPSTILTPSTSVSSLSTPFGAEPTKTVPMAFHSTTSATSSPTSDPPLTPPLTVSQKAGVGIAGATGILIAVIAAIYIARRYRANHARRSSTGSMYPKVAYLYDPPADGSRRDGDVEAALMSGGAAGMPLAYGFNPQRPPNSVEYTKRHSTSTMPMRYSDPGNPFRDLEDRSKCSDESTRGPSHNSIDAETALSATIEGYRSASQASSANFDISVLEREESIDWPSPSLDSGLGGSARSASRQSILSEIASMACSPTARYNTKESRLQPPSPYGFYPNHSLPCVRETAYTDSCRDPFEHDLLLEVDTRTETPNFVTIYAPSTKSNRPAQATAPIAVQSNNPWASSMLNSDATRSAIPLERLPLGAGPISPDATIVASERCSLVYDDHVTSTYVAPSQQQKDSALSPVSPLSGALHRGWDDIKRYSAEKVVPSAPTLSPPLGYSNKQRSLPQLRRKEPVHTDLEETHISSTRLPLALKIPFAHNRISSAETPKTEVHTAHEALLRGRRLYQVRSQDSTFSHSVQSLASLVQKKKSRDMEFACAGV